MRLNQLIRSDLHLLSYTISPQPKSQTSSHYVFEHLGLGLGVTHVDTKISTECLLSIDLRHSPTIGHHQERYRSVIGLIRQIVCCVDWVDEIFTLETGWYDLIRVEAPVWLLVGRDCLVLILHP